MQDYTEQLQEYKLWIEENYPEHDRTSCNDENLYNAGNIMFRYRCSRCESLRQLKVWKLEQGIRN